MQLKDHMQSTLSQLGNEFQELHVALDNYYMTFRSSLHWVILHHQLGIEKMVEQFGESCRAAAEIHIKDDFGFVPIGPTDPRLLKHVYYNGPWDLEHAEEVLEKEYGQSFDLEAAYDNLKGSCSMLMLRFGPNNEIVVQINDELNDLLRSIWEDDQERQIALEKLIDSKIYSKGDGFRYSTTDVRRWIHKHALKLKEESSI